MKVSQSEKWLHSDKAQKYPQLYYFKSPQSLQLRLEDLTSEIRSLWSYLVSESEHVFPWSPDDHSARRSLILTKIVILQKYSYVNC